MAKDLRRTKRVAHLLKTMEHVARKELSDVNRDVTDLHAEHWRLLESLSGDHDLGGLFVDLMAKRANSIARSIDAKLVEQAAATVVWRQARLKSDAAQDVVVEAQHAVDYERTAKDMERLLEEGQMSGRARSR